MRIFVDANTLISAVVFRGLEHEVLKLANKKKANLMTSEHVVEEVFEVLRRKFPNKTYLLKEFLQLAEVQIIVKQRYTDLITGQEVRDLKDKHVLAAAIAANCKYLVSGDKDLTTLRLYKGVEIVRSRRLLELIT